MKDLFNRLHRKNYSNVAIASHVGISVKTLKQLKTLRADIPGNIKNRIILKRMQQLRKNGSGGKI